MNSRDKSKGNWIDGCVDISVVSPVWRKIESKVCLSLSREIEKELNDPTQKQMLFEILGTDFVEKYCPSNANDNLPENTSSKKKSEKKKAEVHSLVTNFIDSAVQGKGTKSKKKNKKNAEFSSFSEEVNGIVKSCYNKQRKKSKKSNNSLKEWKQLLECDVSLVEYLVSMFHTKFVLLSENLRPLIWMKVMSSKEKGKGKSSHSKEKILQLHLQKNNSFLSEFDSKNIRMSSFVNTVYRDNKNIRSSYSEDNLQLTLNMLDTISSYRKKFEYPYTFWVIEVLRVFCSDITSDDDADIASGLITTEKILRLGYPAPEQLQQMSSKVLQTVHQKNKELYDRIKQKMLTSVPKNAENEISYSQSADLITSNPELYIQKWLSEGFVSILSKEASLFVWDSLILNNWESSVLHNLCLALMGLLKPWFMQASSCDEIGKVFLQETGNLYLADIRNAWQHVQNSGNLKELPSMNHNIKYDMTAPSPEPMPPPPKQPTPVPARQPSPPPPPPAPAFIPWLPYAKEKAKEFSSVKPKVDAPFDFYIDSVRFVPDNGTIVKVSGKFLNMYLGRQGKQIRLVAYPVLDSCSRYPAFRLKQLVNEEKLPMNPDVVIMLRTYTVERHSKHAVVLGSCLFCPFSNKQGKQATLRTGGHQIRLRYGVPDPDFTIEHMLASHMDDNIIIPGATILLRVLAAEEKYVDPPAYESGNYRSEVARPNGSEKNLFKHYENSQNFGITVRDAAVLLCGITSASDQAMEQSIKQLLDKEGSNAEDFPYQRFVNYDQDMGMMVLVDKAYGFPIFLEGRVIQCLVQYFPGEDTKKGNSKSKVLSFVTENLNLDSYQRAPDWSDSPTKLNPSYDDHGYLLITLNGLRPQYNIELKKITDKKGNEPTFDLQNSVAWSAVSCFQKEAVYAGTHMVPLLKGYPPDEVRDKLAYLPLDYVCKKFSNQVKLYDTASIEITLWDGHFQSSECPPLPLHTNFLKISPNPKKYIAAKEQKLGGTISQLLRSGMTNSSDYTSHKEQIVSLLKEIFKKNLNEALKKAGYSKLI